MAARFLLSQAAHAIKPTIVVVPGAGLSWAHLHPLLFALSSTNEFDVVRFSPRAATYSAGPVESLDDEASIRSQAFMLANALDSLKPHLESGRHAVASLRRSHGLLGSSESAAAWNDNCSSHPQDDGDALSGGLLHFVTHGTGALVLRGALACRDWNGISSRVVMLAPPNRGSVAARRLWQDQRLGRPFLKHWLGNAIAQELGECTGAHFDGYGGLPASFRTWIVAGSGVASPLASRVPGLRGSLLVPARYGPHDGVVSVADTACFSQTAYRVAAAAAEHRARSQMMQSLFARDPAPARRSMLSGERRSSISRPGRGRPGATARHTVPLESLPAGEASESADDASSQVASSGRIFSPNIAQSVVPAGHVSVCYAPSVLRGTLAFLRRGQPGMHAVAISGLPDTSAMPHANDWRSRVSGDSLRLAEPGDLRASAAAAADGLSELAATSASCGSPADPLGIHSPER